MAAVLNYDQNSDDEATRPSLSRANEVEEGAGSTFPVSSWPRSRPQKNLQNIDGNLEEAHVVEVSNSDLSTPEKEKEEIISSQGRLSFARASGSDATWFESAHKSEANIIDETGAPNDQLPNSTEECSTSCLAGASDITVADALHEVAPTSHEMETNSKNIPQPIIKSSEELGHTVAVMASTVASVVTAPEDDHTSIVRAEAVETTLKSDGPDSDLKDCIFPFRIKREAYLKAMEWNRQLMDLQAVLISTEQRVRIDGRVQRENSGRSASRSLLVDQAANYGDRDLHSRQEEHTAEEELTPLMAAINTKDLGRVFQVVTESLLAMADTMEGGSPRAPLGDDTSATTSDADAKKERIVVEKENKYLRQILNEPNKYGDRALSLAAYNGSVDIVSFLLEKGADVDAQSLSGYTALMLTVSFKSKAHIEVVRLLLKSWSQPKSK